MRRVFLLIAVSVGSLLPGFAQRPNVILVTIDTLRADRLGCYGNADGLTPNLDRLCRESLVFERAIAQVPLTFPSHAAILTATYPFHNGVQDFTSPPLAPQFRTLAEAIRANGYSTGAVVSSFVLDRSWGLARGFQFYDDAFSGEQYLNRDLALVERPARQSVSRALDWLRKARPPFLLWLHLFDPHSPYEAPEPFRSRFKEHPYDGEVAYADAQLGRLFSFLREQKLYPNTAIVVLSDHGESLGEHGEQEHGFFVYNSTVHVPLIVKLPAASRVRPRRVAQAVETISVGPAILELARVHDSPFQRQAQAQSLLAPISTSSTAYSETFYPFSSFGWSPLRGLQTSRFHYIEAPETELYDLDRDPDEKENALARHEAVAGVVRQQLHERVQQYQGAQPGAGTELDASVVERLRALGYVAHRSPGKAALRGDLADPKRKIGDYQAVLAATDAFRAADFARGEQLLKGVGERNPEMYLVPFMLGEAALRQKNWSAAVTHLTRSLELSPEFEEAMLALARALHATGRGEEARNWTEKLLQKNPRHARAWYQLGRFEMERDPAAARNALEKTLALQPNLAPAARDLGLLEFRSREYDKAVKHLAHASELGLSDPFLLNFLGIAYSQTNRLQKAVQCYRKAIGQDPRHAEAHLNLGHALRRLNQQQAALREFRRACELNAQLCQYVPQR